MPRIGECVYLTMEEIEAATRHALKIKDVDNKAGIYDDKKASYTSAEVNIQGSLGELAAHKLWCISWMPEVLPGPTKKGDILIHDRWYDVKCQFPASFGRVMNINRRCERAAVVGFMCLDRKEDCFIYRGLISKENAISQKYRTAHKNGDHGYFYEIPQKDLREIL